MSVAVENRSRFPTCDSGWKIGPIFCTCNQPIERDVANSIMIPPGTTLTVHVYRKGFEIVKMDTNLTCDHPHPLYLFTLDALQQIYHDVRLKDIDDLLARVYFEKHCLMHKTLHFHVA